MTAQQKLYKVLVIGDYCLDIFNLCRSTRLNPESSAPLVQVGSVYTKEGMAGNVNACLQELGLSTKTVFSNTTSTKTRYINATTNEQLLRVDFDAKVDPLDTLDLENTLYPWLYDAIVVSDYDKGFLSYDMINKIVELADIKPVFLDTKKKNLKYFDTRIILKINEHEANAAYSVPDHTIVTMGGAGVLWYNNRWRAYKTEVADVCGAGDAFLAGLVYGYLTDHDNMIEHGVVNGGLAVRHRGTYAPTLEEHSESFLKYVKEYN